jgi:glycosyltransferase involved in cell wall biosynthesis
MRIGMLVNNLEVSGGYQKLVIRLAQQLQNFGHTVVVYTPKLDKNNCYPNDISTITTVTIPPDKGNMTPVAAYTELIKKVDPTLDAFIIHDELSLLGIALLPSAATRNIVWMLNNQLPEKLRLYWPEARSVYTHTVGPLSVKLRETKKAVDRVKLFRLGLNRVKTFATYDEFNKQLVERTLGKKDVVVVAAGADLERFKVYAKKRLFKTKKTYNILSVGVVFPHRRYEDLIRATALLLGRGLSVKTTVVGRQDLSPEYFNELKSLVTELNITKQVVFKHYVSDDEMVRLYTDSDVFVFINDGFTWGISVFEAVAAGIPCVITDNIGAADLIESGKTGWKVPPQDPEAVSIAVGEILHNRPLAAEISSSATTQVGDYVSWKNYTKRMLKLLDR